MRRTTASAAVMMTALMASTTNVLAADPPTLDRVTAAKILTIKGNTDVTVKAVVQGVGAIGVCAFSSPNVAMVLSDVTARGKREGTMVYFFYDAEQGWFCFDSPAMSGRDLLRIWSLKGYQETGPAPTK